MDENNEPVVDPEVLAMRGILEQAYAAGGEAAALAVVLAVTEEQDAAEDAITQRLMRHIIDDDI